MSEEIKTPTELLPGIDDAAIAAPGETVSPAAPAVAETEMSEPIPFVGDAPDIFTPAPPRLIESRAITATAILKSEATLPPEIDDLVSPSVRAMLVVATASERKMARVRRRVVAYLRYSTVNQRPESLARQEELLRIFAELNDLEIVKVFIDAAVSGTIRHRKGLDGALDFIMEGGADGLLVEDCDRLARRFTIIPTIYEQLTLARKQLWDRRHGIIDSELKAAIVAAMASSDYRKLRERLHIGQRKLIENGFIPTCGFGYSAVPGQPGVRVVNLQQAEIVREIFRLYVHEKKSFFQIARQLNSQGSRPLRGRFWRSRGIAAILSKPLYKGLYIYGRKEDDGADDEDYVFDTLMVRVPHLAIVDVQLWNAAETRLREARPSEHVRQNYARRQSVKRAYATSDILSRKVVCSHCDAVMWQHSSVKRGHRYRGFACISPQYTQHQPRIHSDELRSAVMAEVRSLVSGAEHEYLFSKCWTEGRERREADLRSALSRTRAQIATVEAQIEESWLPDWMCGYSNEMKAERRRQLETSIKRLRLEKDEAAAELRTFAAQEHQRESLMAKLALVTGPEALSPQAPGVGETLAAISSILRCVTVRYDDADNRFDVSIELCPNGDSDAADPRIITRERKLWQLNGGGGVSEAYLDLVRQHRDAGRWSLSDQEFDDLRLHSPAIRRGREREATKSMIEGLLCCNETGMSVSCLSKIVEGPQRGGIGLYVRFARRGGKSELRDWMLGKATTRPALVPKDDFLPSHSKLRSLLAL